MQGALSAASSLVALFFLNGFFVHFFFWFQVWRNGRCGPRALSATSSQADADKFEKMAGTVSQDGWKSPTRFVSVGGGFVERFLARAVVGA